jgi:hypothetical protein
MRITRIGATPVNIPLEAPMYWTAGHYPDASSGVELDRAARAHWHRHFVEHGPLDYFQDPLAPGRLRRLPLN